MANPDDRGDIYRGSELNRIFGDNSAEGPNDIFELSEKLGAALRIDCGTEDYLLAHHRCFHRRLDRLGLAHDDAEHPGSHVWACWDEPVRDTIAFFAKILGLKRI